MNATTPSPDPHELATELRRAGLTDVDASNRRRAEYSTDASNYRLLPHVVVFPRAVEEVQAALAVATAYGVPLTSRGGGTSTAGNAVGTGMVLDFSRHLNRVLAIDPDARTARAEPGAVLDDITRAATPHGLRFGPDPATHARATIGGAIGNNACGARALRYGRTADNIVELDVLAGDGTRLSAGPRRSVPATADPPGDTPLAELQRIVHGNLAVIRTEFGRLTRQISGYSLEHLLPERHGNVGKFLVGTEGTLAIVLGATVRLVQSPPSVALAVLGYADMPSAADAVPALLAHWPVAIEGLDARLVEVVRARRGTSAVPDLPRGSGWLLVETAADTEEQARAAARALAADSACLDSTVVSGHHAAALWRIREDGAGLGGRTPAGAPAWPGWEDAAVPPEHLGDYLRGFAALLTEHRVDGLLFGHFGDGCVHARIDFPLATDPGRFREFIQASARLVAEFGGSMSGEHGDGRARGELLPYMYSPEALAVFRAIKRIFDPHNILNPGVIVDPAPIDAQLRLPAARPLRARLGFAYPDDDNDLSTALHRCVGIGKCRADTTATGGVMCPSYLATRDEKDSTRGRARVLQELANGTLVNSYRAPELREALDLCLSCKGCSADCPAGVDMATYKAEILHQRYRHRLRPSAHYALGWLPRWARLASATPDLANRVLHTDWIANLVKRAGGIDHHRPLPRFAHRTFRNWFTREPPRHGGTPVILWVDTFTNQFAPEVGQAAVRVLHDAGYAVHIPDRPVCCGLTWISTGQLDGARRQLRRTLTVLDRTAPAGTPIVGLEPSCTAVLRNELTELLPNDRRAIRLPAHVRTLAELLTTTPGWFPPPMSDVHGIAQPHCHHHAVMGWHTDAELLSAGGATIKAIGGCCGLAGNFGVERGHYEISRAVAETALLPAVRALPHGGVILADGFSCRTQLEQLAHTRSHHLAQLLDSHTLRSTGPLAYPPS